MWLLSEAGKCSNMFIKVNYVNLQFAGKQVSVKKKVLLIDLF